MTSGLELAFGAIFEGGPAIDARSLDCRNVELLAAKFVRTSDGEYYQAPAGGKSDLASIPREFWGPPFYLTPFGLYAPACVVHDGAYQNWLLVMRNGIWVPADLSKDRSDDLLNALMFSSGVETETRLKIYNGVRFGGWRAFREDRGAA
ncbi:MAG: DUF1353 domain-containing protein [Patescibacteria group bacterium]|nr:DUF1353 domain-containing protein [Patescibacteria group bacterium]